MADAPNTQTNVQDGRQGDPRYNDGTRPNLPTDLPRPDNANPDAKPRKDETESQSEKREKTESEKEDKSGSEKGGKKGGK